MNRPARSHTCARGRSLAAAICLGLSIANSVSAGEAVIAFVDAAGAPLSDAVAYLVPRDPPKASTGRAQVDQINKQFVPDVSVIQAGTSVAFPNSDNIRHHVYSFSPAKTFDLKLYSGRASSPVVFDKAGVVTLGCNIHDQMVAWILVVDTPWFAKSDAKGNASIGAVPNGDYELRVWHPDIASEPAPQQIRIAGTFSRSIRLPARALTQLRRDVTTPGSQ